MLGFLSRGVVSFPVGTSDSKCAFFFLPRSGEAVIRGVELEVPDFPVGASFAGPKGVVSPGQVVFALDMRSVVLEVWDSPESLLVRLCLVCKPPFPVRSVSDL